MKKVLITGGAGFIGFYLAKHLVSKNYQIDLIDNLSRGVEDKDFENLIKNDNINFLKLDLLNTNYDKLINIKNDYDYIYHLAAIVGVKHVSKTPYEVLSKNYDLLKNAIKISQFQKNLKKFIFASTSEVYSGTLASYGLKFPTNEKTPLTCSSLVEARSTYMLSKIYGEAMCFHSGLPITIVRPHNFYGPRMGLSHVIPELFKKLIELDSEGLKVFSVNHSRSFCYIEDAVNMIHELGISPQTVNEVYNIGNDDEEIKIGDLAYKIINLVKKGTKIITMPETEGSPKRRLPDIEKAKSIFKYKKKYNLDEGLKYTLEWYKNNVFVEGGVSAL